MYTILYSLQLEIENNCKTLFQLDSLVGKILHLNVLEDLIITANQ